MENKNYVFIAKSLDGYIADKDGNVDFLESVPNPENKDVGFVKFTAKIDAIVMGRATYEKVLSFNVPWPYAHPVFVVSTSLENISEEHKDKVELIKGTPKEITAKLNEKGFRKLYIDGGKTVQSFLQEDLIDELIISTIPIILGGGIPLFAELPKQLLWEWVKSEVFLDAITQDTYRRKR